MAFTLANDLPHDFADKGVLSVLVAEFYQSDICRFKATTVALTLGCKLAAGCYHFRTPNTFETTCNRLGSWA